MTEQTGPPDPFQLCGTTIEGKYRIASVVGDGGFGVVYRGVHKGFGELIAVKCLKLPHTPDEQQREQLLEQLRDEGRLLHRLSRATSGIVQALDVGAFTTAAGTWVPYLVLEWLEGQTLAEFLRDRAQSGAGGLPLRDALELLEPAARALAVAHAQKVAHRDVKPANLFVSDVGGKRTVKVLDFGIAKVLTSNASITAALEATKLGPTAFTPRYGAPEQFNKQRGASGPWTDVFALALILVEMVSGRRALDGDDPTQLYVAAADPTLRPTLRARGVDVPDEVERVLQKALGVEPKQRYPNAGEFWDALLAAAGSAPSPRADAPPRGAASAGAAAAATRPDAVASTLPGPEALARGDVRADASTARDALPAADAPRARPPQGPVAYAPTMPVESLRASQAEAPHVARVHLGGDSPHPGAPPAQSGAGNARDVAEDSMVETPISARARVPSVRPRELGPSTSAPVSELPGAPAAERAPRPGGRGVWPWFAGAALIGAGVIAYTQLVPVDPLPSPTSSARPKGTAAPRPTARANASAAASASASASVAAPPPTPPDDMIYVAPATLRMGEGSAVQVTVSRGFFLDRTEVTVRAYQACMTKRMCSPANQVVVPPTPGAAAGETGGPGPEEVADAWSKRCNEPRRALDHPINCVDYSSADSYCRFRGRRLPTEAEWELAARGAAGRAYAWGPDAPDCDRSCHDRNGACRAAAEAVSTCAVGQPPRDVTPEGALGLGGNVAEWVVDGYAASPPAGNDPRGPEASALRVVRGGSFIDEADRLRSTTREGVPPAAAHVRIGFRCAMDVPVAP